MSRIIDRCYAWFNKAPPSLVAARHRRAEDTAVVALRTWGLATVDQVKQHQLNKLTNVK